MTRPALGSGRLALANLRRKPVRSACLVAIVALFAFALFAGVLLNSSLSRGLSSLSSRLGGDIMLVPYGYEKEMQAALLRGEPSQFYLKSDLAQKVRAFPGVSAASTQLFLASLSSGCCTIKVQLIGYDPESDFVVAPWMSSALNRPLADDEVVVGALIVPDVGEKVSFFSREYTIAAKMERTGMGFDSSVFMNMNAIRALMKSSGVVSGDVDSLQDFASSVIIKVRDGEDVKDVANELMRAFAIDYNLDLVIATGMISDISASLRNLDIILYFMAGLLWIISVLTLLLVFSSILNERKRELAIMRILGAGKNKLSTMFLLEILYICLTGAVVGVFFSALLLLPFMPLLFTSLGLPYLPLASSNILCAALLVGLLTMATGLFACIWMVLSIARKDVYSTLREGE